MPLFLEADLLNDPPLRKSPRPIWPIGLAMSIIKEHLGFSTPTSISYPRSQAAHLSCSRAAPLARPTAPLHSLSLALSISSSTVMWMAPPNGLDGGSFTRQICGRGGRIRLWWLDPRAWWPDPSAWWPNPPVVAKFAVVVSRSAHGGQIHGQGGELATRARWLTTRVQIQLCGGQIWRATAATRGWVWQARGWAQQTYPWVFLFLFYLIYQAFESPR